MTASALHRKLLFCGYTDLTSHIGNSPLNLFIYSQILEWRKEYYLEPSDLDIFNEVYYQCVRVQYDDTPGEQIMERHVNDCVDWLKSRNAAELVFCLVWGIFMLKEKNSYQESLFMQHLYPLLRYSYIMRKVNLMVEEMINRGITVPDSFVTLTAPVEDLVDEDTPLRLFEFIARFIMSFPLMTSVTYMTDGNPWRSVTNGFSTVFIMRYLCLYNRADDQLQLLHHIESACNYRERRRLRRFFRQVREQISIGRKESAADSIAVVPLMADSDPMAHQFLIADYEQRLQQQKNDYELQISRMEAKYKSELAALQEKLKSREHRRDNLKQVRDQALKPADKGKPFFTIEEMVEYMKERFSKQAADECCGMFFSLSTLHHTDFNQSVFKLIDSVGPYILRRTSLHQTFEIPSVGQLNTNPGTVVNHVPDDKECR